ncbi:MAG: hypothetical protein QOG43_2304 [Actinomycetota bacterium]|nr:hypothetical protein [Actinomycetota bacterium]
MAVLPLPAWSAFMDPAYAAEAQDGRPPAGPSAALSVPRHFDFLPAAGFALVPPDNWEQEPVLAIPFSRPDAVVLVVVHDATLFVLVTPPVSGDVTARAVLQGLIAARPDRPAVATFGSFPLVGPSDLAIARHASAFAQACGDLLRRVPLPLNLVASATAAAVGAMQHDVVVAHYRTRGAAARAEGRDGSCAEAYRRLSALETLTADEAGALARAEARLASRPAVLERGEESDWEWVERRAAHLRQKHRALGEAFDARGRPGGHGPWEDAARELREAVDVMYPPEFWADVARLRGGDPGAIEPALVFLEADPWCFRSGYAKETILALLPRHELSQDQRERVQAILLRAVDVGDRREFRGHRRLARTLGGPRLREELRRRLRSDDPGVARRALRMLTTVRQARLDPSEVAIARQIILGAARGADRDDWWVPDWVGELASRFWSAEWSRELAMAALDAGPEADAARRVLVDVPRAEIDDDLRPGFRRLLLGVVDEGGDESWFEGLAPLVDDPDLQRALAERMEHPDGGVRRRAWWALNAIRREGERKGRRADP